MNLADQFRLMGIDYEPVTFDGQDQVVDSYESGSADAWTTDRSGWQRVSTHWETPMIILSFLMLSRKNHSPLS
ncbi:hypothetical protein JCM19046_2834 [Bacillus sp. JCM 19046]|nr:hypothetical protein JCM19045_1631 [Bacillus sp. JCM 19045]GAF18270.1 hypothetical protein JCM19046_2834 [Bacillus sp. JCM 19046]